MLYSDYITAITALLDISATVTNAASASPTTNADFNGAIPRAIEYTENRIQRDLDLINTYVTDESKALTASTRRFLLPTGTGTFVVVTQAYLIVAGQRQAPLLPVALEGLNSFYPSDTPLSPTPSYPVFWAPNDGVSIVVGPAPDSTYTLGIVGTQRFVPLSSINTSNFLTLQLPDPYIAASMVWWAGWMRDYGLQADDPKMAMSWEGQYQNLMKPTLVEEKRKFFQSMGWTGRLPSPIASPPQN